MGPHLLEAIRCTHVPPEPGAPEPGAPEPGELPPDLDRFARESIRYMWWGFTPRRTQVSNSKRWRVSSGNSRGQGKYVYLEVSVSELLRGQRVKWSPLRNEIAVSKSMEKEKITTADLQ